MQAVTRRVPQLAGPGTLPHSWLPGTARAGARAAVKPPLAGGASSHPCSGSPVLQACGHAVSQASQACTCVTGFPSMYPHLPLTSGEQTPWMHPEQSVGAGVIISPKHTKLLCFRRAEHSQPQPQLMGAAARAQQPWKLHSWERKEMAYPAMNL